MSDTVVELDPPEEGNLQSYMLRLREWLHETCPDRKWSSKYLFRQRPNEPLEVRKIKFKFERPQDAVLFKLVHGGNK